MQVCTRKKRSIRTGMDGRNLVLGLIAHVGVNEEGIEIENQVERTTFAGEESMIIQWAAMTIAEDIRGLIWNAPQLRQNTLQIFHQLLALRI